MYTMEELTSQTCYQQFVSSCGKLISFKSKQAPGVIEGESGELLFSTYSFQMKEKSFLNDANGEAVVTRTKSTYVEIVTCKCVLHAQRKITVPCVLVARNAKKSDGCQYSLFILSTSNQLQLCLKFKLPYKITSHVSISQGPTVMWSQAGHVCYISLQGEAVQQVPMQMTHMIVAELPLYKGSFVLGLQNFSGQDVLTNQTCGYFFHDGQTFDGSVVLPHPYISITSALLVLSAVKSDDVLNTSLVVTTFKGQLLFVENGVVKQVCQLPFPQAKDIQLVNTGRNGFLFVISFKEGYVCAVWKETFTVCTTKPNTS